MLTNMMNLLWMPMLLLDADDGGAGGAGDDDGGAGGGDKGGENTDGNKGDKLGYRSTLRPDQRETDLAKKFGKVPELFDYAADLDAKIKNAIIRPQDTEDKKAVDAFYEQLGWPKSADAYEIPVDGKTEDEKKASEYVINMYKEAAHKSRMPKALAEGFYKEFADITARETARLKEAEEKQIAEVTKEMQVKYGDQAPELINGANQFVLRYAGDDFWKFINTPNSDGVTLGNDPRFASGMVELYKLVKEDKVSFGRTPGSRPGSGYKYPE